MTVEWSGGAQKKAVEERGRMEAARKEGKDSRDQSFWYTPVREKKGKTGATQGLGHV